MRLLDLDGQAAFGTVTVPAADFTGGNVFDEANSLTVRLVGDQTLESVTSFAIFNGANAALVGDELLQFRNAVEIEAGKYRLSGLLRGRLGTEWAIGGHVAGERFVLIDGRLGKTSRLPLFTIAPDLIKALAWGARWQYGAAGFHLRCPRFKTLFAGTGKRRTGWQRQSCRELDTANQAGRRMAG